MICWPYKPVQTEMDTYKTVSTARSVRILLVKASVIESHLWSHLWIHVVVRVLWQQQFCAVIRSSAAWSAADNMGDYDILFTIIKYLTPLCRRKSHSYLYYSYVYQ